MLIYISKNVWELKGALHVSLGTIEGNDTFVITFLV